MSRQNIADLRLPRKRYRIERELERFETPFFSLSENETRASLLEAALAGGQLTPAQRKRTKRLQKRLREPFRPGKLPEFTAASHVSMREWRICLFAELLRLTKSLKRKQWRVFTAILPHWRVGSDQLEGVDAATIPKEFRTDLDNAQRRLVAAGRLKPDGWLYAMIHGEFDATTGGFQLHLHGLATKGMIEVLKALRKRPSRPGTRKRRKVRQPGKYRPDERDRERYPYACIPAKKLQIEKPRNPAEAISYTSKSYWVQHNSMIDERGRRKRLGEKGRIPGIHQARYLLWLDRHGLKDLTLLVGLRVIDGRITPAR